MQRHKLAVVATIGADGGPQSALVGVGATNGLEVVFDTLSTTRKHANLQRDRRIAVTFSGPDEQTLHYEGVAVPVSVASAEDEVYRQAYYQAWPEERQHLQWQNLVYWRVVPRWARYSDYDRGPLILEFHWNRELGFTTGPLRDWIVWPWVAFDSPTAYYRSMDAKLILRFLAAFVGFAMSSFAQIDGAKFAADVRAKYGTPLARQTFMIPAGEMVVDYASNGNVCRIQLPSMGPEEGQPGVRSTKAVDEFVLKLVPLTLRGKELRRMLQVHSLHSVSTIEYENVVIAEGLLGQKRTGVMVTFTTETCQDQPAQ